MGKKDYEILEAHTVDDMEAAIENAVNLDGYTLLAESFTATATGYAVIVVQTDRHGD